VRALIDTCTNRRKGYVSDTAAYPLSHLAYSRKKGGKKKKQDTDMMYLRKHLSR